MAVPAIGNTFFERALMLDSGPLISLYSPRDQRANSVRQLLSSFALEKYPVCITYLTIAEIHRRLLFDISRSRAMDFLEHSLDGSLNILNLNPTDTLYSKDILYRFNDQDISFTDASSMAIMQRLGIIKVLSYDFHFSLLGFDLINPT